MQAFEEESKRVLKKQRMCAAQIDAHLDFLLEEVAITKQQLEDKQHEYRRKKNRSLQHEEKPHSGSEADEEEKQHCEQDNTAITKAAADREAVQEATGHADSRDGATTENSEHSETHTGNEHTMNKQSGGDDGKATDSTASEEQKSALQASDCVAVVVEEEDDDVDKVLQGFIHRVRLLNVEKNVSDELKAIHVALSKYSKQIDKTFCNDITKVCRAKEFDHKLVCRLVAEYLYQDGQIEAADSICKEAELDLSPNYRECFVELHVILKSLKQKNMDPALEWARKHRKDLRQQNIEIEFELVRLQYVDLIEKCTDPVDALNFATEEFSVFHDTHSKGMEMSMRSGSACALFSSTQYKSNEFDGFAVEIHRLMGCLVFKNRLNESPYRDLFTDTRWEDIRTSIIRACCRLRRVPFKSYLDTCLSAGVSALPAMRKLVTVMENKLTNWETMEELPVEIPISNDLRFHTVFCCPVSKEESAPGNPPVLLKCGHAICKACEI
uniref:CTLH domain-containing protein n=1 Tax=Globisporangium ultimum (strain ATCC 200006 / CBS 805.95 / DAOM BR144) TaxID=431595 RepID=K3WCZ0_GLOUD